MKILPLFTGLDFCVRFEKTEKVFIFECKQRLQRQLKTSSHQIASFLENLEIVNKESLNQSSSWENY